MDAHTFYIFIFAILGFLIVGMLFNSFIYPVWMLIHCCCNKQLNNGTKAFWAVFILFSFSLFNLGGILYSFFASGKKFLKWVAIIDLMVMLTLVVSFAGSFSSIYNEMAPKQIRTISGNIDQYDLSELTPKEVAHFEQSLVQFQEDIHCNWYEFKKAFRNTSITNMLNTILKDKKLSSDEYHDFIDAFDHRETYSFKELDHLRKKYDKNSP